MLKLKSIHRKGIKILILLTATLAFGLIMLVNFPWPNGLRAYSIISGSMAPLIQTGSLAIVQSTAYQDIKVNDIVAFYDPKDVRKVVIHRVAGITKGAKRDKRTFFITKGDINKNNDPEKVVQGFIIGKYKFSFPYLGYFLNYLKKPIGLIMVIFIPSLIIAIIEFINFRKHLERHYESKYRQKYKKIKPKSLSSQPLSIFSILLILASAFLLSANFEPASSKFTASITTQTMTFKSGDWVAPSSSIVPLSAYQNNLSFNLNYQAQDQGSKVDKISLFYRYNGSGWTLDQTKDIEPDQVNYTGDFIFDSPQGEGIYDFYVSATDTYGNIESNTSAQASTFVDITTPTALLSVSDSWTKTVEEKINDNASFELGDLSGWTRAGDVSVLSSDSISNPGAVINPYEGSFMVRIGNPEDTGQWVWENRLMRSFDSGPKSLSLHYNFLSRELVGFDSPGFFIRMNGESIFQQNSLESDGLNALSTGWQQFYYDLSNHQDAKINLSQYAGNTGDQNVQSWAYIDKVTTYFIAAPSTALYSLIASDTGSGIERIEYKYYPDFQPEPAEWILYANPFKLEEGGSYYLKYRVFDKAGNLTIYSVKVIIDDLSPSKVEDLRIENSSGVNSVTLAWTAPGNDGAFGKASKYDLRYQKDCADSTIFNFAEAQKIEKVEVPKEAGQLELLEIFGLNPATNYCAGLKTADEAPNWSELSNVVTFKTLASEGANYGDIVINELMWMGSSVSAADEWLELRNLTDHEINLAGFYLTKLVDGVEAKMEIDFNNKVIPAHGFFLIANGNSYAGGDSALKVSPDLWDSSLDLSDDSLQIRLYSSTDNLLDSAWDGTSPTEGFIDTIEQQFYSMERVSIAGDGANPLSWYTSIDEASTGDFFDGGEDERGTPGQVNRSENEPLAHQKYLKRSAPSDTPAQSDMPMASPEAILNYSSEGKYVSFIVKNIMNFTKLFYQLTYDDIFSAQGILGETDLLIQNEFAKDNILLGTCSAGGTCVYHEKVSNLKLKIELKDKEEKITTVEAQLQ